MNLLKRWRERKANEFLGKLVFDRVIIFLFINEVTSEENAEMTTR